VVIPIPLNLCYIAVRLLNQLFKMRKFASIALVLFLAFGCQSDPPESLCLPSPLLPEEFDFSARLHYAYYTDQYDRALIDGDDLKAMFSKRSTPLLDSMNLRDSVRLQFVWDSYSAGAFSTCADYFHAGVVFLHGGGQSFLARGDHHRISRELLGTALANQDSTCKGNIKEIKRFRDEADRRVAIDSSGGIKEGQKFRFEIIKE